MTTKNTKPTVYGICGKPCSGKSTFISSLLSTTFTVVDCDSLVKTILQDNKEEIYNLMGTNKPSDIADIIFSDRSKYDEWCRYVWIKMQPIILKRIEDCKTPNIVLDAPLLIESGLVGLCDVVVHFQARMMNRLFWAKKRGVSQSDLIRRDSFFEPIRELGF